MKKGLLLIVIILLNMIISGCNGIPSNLAANFKTEEEITNAVNKEKYNKLHNFIKNNLTNNDKSELLIVAVQSLLETKQPKNIDFLTDTYNSLIKRGKYDELEELAYYLDYDLYNKIDFEIRTYQSAKSNLPSLEKDYELLLNEKNDLISEIPENLPVVGKSVEGFSGVVLQKNQLQHI